MKNIHEWSAQLIYNRLKEDNSKHVKSQIFSQLKKKGSNLTLFFFKRREIKASMACLGKMGSLALIFELCSQIVHFSKYIAKSLYFGTWY